jgi:enamine deaminase RidA (YjgF/YER057c/UK114 family)
MEITRKPVVIAGKPQSYAKGTKATGASGFVVLSGSIGIDIKTGDTPEGAGEQTKIAMTNIKTYLEEYGTSLQNIMHIWLNVKGTFPEGMVEDPRTREVFGAMRAFWDENCPEFRQEDNVPAFTLLGVTSLALKAWHLEIVVIAAVP